jgi:hypothetical protein
MRTNSHSRRGPKPTSAAHGPRTLPIGAAAEPTSKLNREERREFDRLIRVLREKGTLARIDLSSPTDYARLKCQLDGLYKLEPLPVKSILGVQSALRGLRREMSLALQPSRNHIVARPEAPDAHSYWRAKLSGGES